MTDSNFAASPIYEVLSNIIHGRTEPTDKEGAALDLTVLSEGQVALSEFLGESISKNLNGLS